MRLFLIDTVGTAAMEFAICMPLLVSLSLGSAEFGRAIWCHHMLVQIARDTARFASHGDVADAPQVGIYGSLTGTTPLMPPNFGTVTVTVPAPVGGQVTATARFTFTSSVFQWFNIPLTLPMAASHTEEMQAS